MSESTGAASPLPSRTSATVFWAKSSLLKLDRSLKDIRCGLTRFPQSDVTLPELLTESRSALFDDSSVSEAKLQLGKVQNLRIAVRALNGTCVPKGQVFSFWKQIGRATRRRGFVLGRQLREGCIYPEIGGGLCQLSNALYDAAIRAGLEIVERHPHTHVIPGSAAELGRDATVSWNYIDLRFRSSEDFQLELHLSQDELIVRIHGRTKIQRLFRASDLSKAGDSPKLLELERHSCSTCGETACFRHSRGTANEAPETGRTAIMVDEVWPEFQDFVRQTRRPDGVLLLPIDGTKFKKDRYAWDTTGYWRVGEARLATLKRSVSGRKLSTYGARRLQAQVDAAEEIADHLAHRLDHDTVDLYIAQAYLPFLWRNGHLGGRRFKVLLNRLPLKLLHEKLDDAVRRWPERTTLAEYRAPDHIVLWEWDALQAADEVITPNVEIAQIFASKAKLLSWHEPKASPWVHGTSIVFPGPTAARKGAFELREVAARLDLEIVLLGSELEGQRFWEGVRTRRMSSGDEWGDGVAALVQPALVEERPRAILKAQASGIPVIATRSCGVRLGSRDKLVEFGVADDLENAIRTVMSGN